VQSLTWRASRFALLLAFAFIVGVVALVLRVPGASSSSQRRTWPSIRRDFSLAPRTPRQLSPDWNLSDPFTAAFERGIAAYNADDAEAALDAFEEAVRIAPDDPEARINLGLVYMRLQRPDDGLRELSLGARLEREREEARRASPPAPRRKKQPATIKE